MLPFAIAYSLALILCGLCVDPRLRHGGAAAVLLAAAAVGHAGWVFVVMALGYVALTAWMQARPVASWLAWKRGVVWVVASLGLMAHLWPGYQGLALAEDAVLKPGSVAFDLVFHHDKVLVAWSLLGWRPLFGRSDVPRGRPSAWAMPGLVGIGGLALMGLAVGLGLLDWRPGPSEWFAVFAVANLLNTCLAEELLFRGMVQRWLTGRLGWPAGLALAAALFGLAHLAGGPAFVLVVAGAGLLYGLVYLWTGRLVWAVLVHWGLNLAHLALFTYPMSAA
ncbi:CPBP family intramembrane metalloprotease [Halomonas organivorans]